MDFEKMEHKEESTVSLGTISKHSSITTGTAEALTCVKTGNVVNISGRIYGMTNQVANAFLFDISEGFRPKTVVYILAYMVFENNTSEVYFANVNTNGVVSIAYSGVVKIKDIRIAGSYGV